VSAALPVRLRFRLGQIVLRIEAELLRQPAHGFVEILLEILLDNVERRPAPLTRIAQVMHAEILDAIRVERQVFFELGAEIGRRYAIASFAGLGRAWKDVRHPIRVTSNRFAVELLPLLAQFIVVRLMLVLLRLLVLVPLALPPLRWPECLQQD